MFNNITSSGQFFNDADVKILQGAFNNNASLHNYGWIEISENAMFSNLSGTGDLLNYAAMSNSGVFNNAGALQHSDEYVEHKTEFPDEFPAPIHITNNANGTFSNSGSLDSAYLVENTGTFNNTGRFYNHCTASFLNSTGILTGNALEYAYCNDSPVAQADTFTLNEDVEVTFDLLTNDSDADGNLDPASTVALLLPAHGTLNNNFNGTFDYLPDLNFFGSDTFTYQVCDTGPDRDAATDTDDLCAQASVNLTIRSVNDAPSFAAGANPVIGLNAGPQLTPAWASGMSAGALNEAGQLLVFSTDTDKPELFAVQPEVDVASGNLSYVPEADTHGIAQVSVTLADDGGTEHGGVHQTVALLTITILSDPLLDFGDAPDPGYPTSNANDGARHEVVGGLFLGASVDTETDGHPSPVADGDDINNDDDEDGVAFTSSLTPVSSATIEVVASAQGLLNAWIDFNRDGDWDDAGEQVFTDVPLIAGLQSLDFSVPAGANSGQSHARFRINSTGGLAPGGYASDGEVEDYSVTIGARPDAVFKDGFENNP